MQRYDSIQVLRAVAAIAVVVHHTAATQSKYVGHVIDASIGTAGVDLFFVISGFIMAGIGQFYSDSPITPQAFLGRRVTRLVPLYWFYTTAMLVLCLALPQFIHTTTVEPLNVLGSYLFIPFARADGSTHPLVFVGWTLNLEMVFYLVFGLSLFLARRARVLLVPIAIAGLAWISNPIYLEFLYGMFAGWLVFKGLRAREPLAWALMGGGLLLFLLFPKADEVRATTWGLCALLVVLGASSIERRLPAALVLLGDASYSIYLSHVFTVPIVLRALAGTNSYFAIGSAVCFATTMGVVAYLFVEKPLLKLAHRRITFQDVSARTRGEFR